MVLYITKYSVNDYNNYEHFYVNLSYFNCVFYFLFLEFMSYAIYIYVHITHSHSKVIICIRLTV